MVPPATTDMEVPDMFAPHEEAPATLVDLDLDFGLMCPASVTGPAKPATLDYFDNLDWANLDVSTHDLEALLAPQGACSPSNSAGSVGFLNFPTAMSQSTAPSVMAPSTAAPARGRKRKAEEDLTDEEEKVRKQRENARRHRERRKEKAKALERRTQELELKNAHLKQVTATVQGEVNALRRLVRAIVMERGIL